MYSSSDEEDLPYVSLTGGRRSGPSWPPTSRPPTSRPPASNVSRPPAPRPSITASRPSPDIVLCDSDSSDEDMTRRPTQRKRQKGTKDCTNTVSLSTATVVDCDPEHEEEVKLVTMDTEPCCFGSYCGSDRRGKSEALSEKERREEAQKKRIEENKAAALARRMERERQKEKRQQKEMDRAVRKAALQGNKENQPGERVKQMVVVMDTALSENATFMAALATQLESLGVEYHVSGDVHPGSVQWKRRTHERTVNENAQIVQRVYESNEKELLVAMEAQGLAALVYHTMQLKRGSCLETGGQTLCQYVEGLMRDHPGTNVSLAVEGLEGFFRWKKTKSNRQFRQVITGERGKSKATPPNGATLSEVTRLDIEEAAVELQLRLGCELHLFGCPEQLAEYVTTVTKALAEKPFRRDGPFSFYSDSSGPTKKAMRETDNKVTLLWKHQLMQLNNLSEHMATAVASVYPSPAHLIKEYEQCSDGQSAELMLQDIVVRRGVGSIASSRRLGPVQSKRIHTLLTSSDPTLPLT